MNSEFIWQAIYLLLIALSLVLMTNHQLISQASAAVFCSLLVIVYIRVIWLSWRAGMLRRGLAETYYLFKTSTPAASPPIKKLETVAVFVGTVAAVLFVL